MQKYEVTLMVNSEVKGEAKDKLIERMEKIVKALGGKMGKLTEMGLKQLAYKIHDQGEANYISWALELSPEGVVQFGKKLTAEGQKKEILRHLLIKI